MIKIAQNHIPCEIRLSIIIPHFNDAHGLQKCLASLAQQSYAENDFEVIVCDNGSKSFHLDVSRHPFQLKVVAEDARGAYAARNKGIKSASGRIIAFTDCDCELNPDFITNGLKLLQSYGENTVLAGKIVYTPSSNRPTPIEAFEIAFMTDQKAYSKKGLAATGNLWTTKSLLKEVGDFRPLVAEDTDWCQRAYNRGAKFYFGETCIVYHPARTTLPQLREKWSRQVAMQYNTSKSKINFRSTWIVNMLKVFASPFIHSFAALFNPKLPRLLDRFKLLPVLFWCRFFRVKMMFILLTKNEDTVNPGQYWR